MTPTKAPRAVLPVVCLAVLGVIELVCCFYGAHAQNHHRITTAYGTALAQAVPYALASWLALRIAPGRWTFWLVIAFAAAFRIVALFGTAPYLSTDVYRYVWDGRVQGAGINPYRYVSSDPALGSLRDEMVYARMNRPNVRTIYPPGAEIFFFAVTRFGDRVNVMRGAMVAMEAVALWAICALLRGFGISRERALLYAWHPLPVWEFAGSGHVDAAVIAALAVGLWAARRRWTMLVGTALTAASLVKLFPLLLFPAFYRRWDWKMPLILAVGIVVAYLPYLGVGLGTIFDFLLHGYSNEEGLASGERYFLATLTGRFLRLSLPTMAFQIGALSVFAGSALWAVFAPVRDGLTPLRRAAALATAFTVLLSPGYAWYFAWLTLFLPFLPRLGLFWLTAVSFALYANWLHHTLDDFFVINCVLYLPAAGLAVADKFLATPVNPGRLPA